MMIFLTFRYSLPMEKKTLREIFDLYVDYRIQTGMAVGKSSFQPVKSIIYFLEKKKGEKYLTQSLFKEWREDRKRTYSQLCVVRNFLYFANERGYFHIHCPKPVYERHPRKRVLDRPLKRSAVSDMMTKFFKWRDKSIPLNDNYKYILIRFNNYCYDIFCSNKELTNEMVEQWAAQGETESAVTRNVRTSALNNFLEYAQSQGWTHINLVDKYPVIEKRGQKGHVFTHEELTQFFALIDAKERHQTEAVPEFKRRKLVTSVIFRFLYSTGMKLIDTVSLNREDVDFEKGLVSFDTFNGRRHQVVALAPSLLEQLKRYDAAMDKLMPGRKPLFPNRDKVTLKPNSVEKIFINTWYQMSDTRAKVSDFRLTFAIENINSWDYDGTEWTIQLLHLSRAMGHESMKITQNYLNMVPRYRDILTKLSGQNLSKLLPNLEELIDNEEES